MCLRAADEHHVQSATLYPWACPSAGGLWPHGCPGYCGGPAPLSLAFAPTNRDGCLAALELDRQVLR